MIGYSEFIFYIPNKLLIVVKHDFARSPRLCSRVIFLSLTHLHFMIRTSTFNQSEVHFVTRSTNPKRRFDTPHSVNPETTEMPGMITAKKARNLENAGAL